MIKNYKKYFFVLLLTLVMIPVLNVNASSTVTVHDQTELKEALKNTNVGTIILANDIETTEKINITREVTIDGNSHTMKYVGTFDSRGSKDNTIWAGIYILQVYKTSATIKNIKLTGGNAGLLINGSTVKLEGTIDVSNNGFGGIELSQGKGVNIVSHLKLDNNTKIINTTETANKPTLWVPADSLSAILEISGIQKSISPGDELTLQEAMNLFITVENPETNDSIILFLFLSMIGIFTFGYAIRKLIITEI